MGNETKKPGSRFEQQNILWGDGESTPVTVEKPAERPKIMMGEDVGPSPSAAPAAPAKAPREGYHYEQRELKMMDGDSRMVNVEVPDEKPEIMWDGNDAAPQAEAGGQELDSMAEQDLGDAGEGYHYEMREFKLVDGDSLMVKTRVPNEKPKIKIVGAETDEPEESDADAKDYGQEGSDGSGASTGSYVCANAQLKCPFGTAPSSLFVGPDRTTSLGGKPMANIMDFTPLYNIKPFGQCSSMAFPATASATAAAMGTLTPMPCIPSIVSPWVPGKANLLVNGMPALMNICTCTCMWGGVITIQQDGQ